MGMDCSLTFCSHLCSCTLSICLLCVLCVRMYMRMCVCSFVAVAHCLHCSLTHPHNTHPLMHTHTCPNTHRNSQSLPILLWRRSRLSQKPRLKGEWLHCTELQALHVITCACTHMHTCTCAHTHVHMHVRAHTHH